MAWKLGEQVELYGNWGRGFHSNDARGVVNLLSDFTFELGLSLLGVLALIGLLAHLMRKPAARCSNSC